MASLAAVVAAMLDACARKSTGAYPIQDALVKACSAWATNADAVGCDADCSISSTSLNGYDPGESDEDTPI